MKVKIAGAWVDVTHIASASGGIVEGQGTADVPLTGTLSFTLNSGTVTGTGTAFLTEVSTGTILKVGSTFHAVRHVSSDTDLTLFSVAPATVVGATAYKQGDLLVLESENGDPQFVVNGSGDLVWLDDAGNVRASIHQGTRARLLSATGWAPDGSSDIGLMLEHGIEEGSGIYLGENTVVMWSAGDNGYLQLWDEDELSTATQPAWHFDTSGTLHVNSPEFALNLSMLDRYPLVVGSDYTVRIMNAVSMEIAGGGSGDYATFTESSSTVLKASGPAFATLLDVGDPVILIQGGTRVTTTVASIVSATEITVADPWTEATTAYGFIYIENPTLLEALGSDWSTVFAVDKVGVLSAKNIKRGTGSPEGAVVGSRGDFYQRLDGGAATSVYFKGTGDNTNTGWVPLSGVTKPIIDALDIDAETLGGSTKAQIISDTTAAIVDSSPTTLDTLNELAAALGDDPNFATTVTNDIATKVAKSLYDANTILKADTDDTPVALTVGEQTMVGRITGGEITALTPAQIRTLLNVTETKTIRIGHGFAIKGTAANGEIPGFFVSLPTGQTAKIVAAEHATESGTVTAQVRKNGTALTDLTALAVTSTPTLTDEDPDVSLANRDYIDINLSAASTPVDLRVTVFVEYTV